MTTLQWLPLPAKLPSLTSNSVHLWSLPLRSPAGTESLWASWLDDEEAKRWKRFRFEHLQDEFLAGHGWLRAILSLYAKCSPGALEYGKEEQGKPTLVSPTSDLCFNLSHSGNQWLLAVTRGRALGVDIEKIRAMDGQEGIVERFYSFLEKRAYKALSESQHLQAFFDVWARKESFLKATGQGLFYPLERFSVTVTGEPALLDVAGEPQALKKWSMAALPEVKGYASALMTEGEPGQLYCWRAETEEAWQWWLQYSSSSSSSS